MKRSHWERLRSRGVGLAPAGSIASAFRHRLRRAVLFLYRPRSRNCAWSKRIGCWCVYRDGQLLGRRSVYGRVPRGVPLRWANRLIRQGSRATERRACRDLYQTVPANEALESLPAGFEELPAVIAGHDRHHDVARSTLNVADDSSVPARLPMVSPTRTLGARFADCVLSREEYVLFVETWSDWMTSHPMLAHSAARCLLKQLCLATVYRHRVVTVRGLGLGERGMRQYHEACVARTNAQAEVETWLRAHGQPAPASWADLLVASASWDPLRIVPPTN